MAHFSAEIAREFEEMKEKKGEGKDLTTSYELIKDYWRAYLSGIDGETVKKRDAEFVKIRDMFFQAAEMKREQKELHERQREFEKRQHKNMQYHKITDLLERAILC